MALVEIPDALLALVAPIANSEGLTTEIQAILLIKDGLRRRSERALATDRQRRHRDASSRCGDVTVTSPQRDSDVAPLSPQGSSLFFPNPSNPNSCPPIPPGPCTRAHERAVLASEEVPFSEPPTRPESDELPEDVLPFSSRPGGLRPAPKPGRYLHRFAEWWAIYPKKRSGLDAQNAWDKLKPNDELVDLLIAAVQTQKTWQDWAKDGGKFIPYPATWINRRMWLDQSPAELAAVLPAVPVAGSRASPRNVTDDAIHEFLARTGGSQ